MLGYSQRREKILSKKLMELKEWASQNITLINLLPKNTTCKVTTRLIDVLEDEVDEKYYLSEEKTKKLTLDTDLGGKLNMYDYNERDKVHSVNNVSPTLNTMQGGDRQPKIAVREATKQSVRIRKLTEKECWRLQGFTDEQFYKAKNSGVSNSQLYKQAGNSVTVNVVDAIVKCL